jgi:hypothetical protein
MAIFFFLTGLVLLGACAILGYYGFRGLERSMRLGIAPTRVSKLRPGVRKIYGRVVLTGKTVLSPLTKKPCVYYRFLVDEERKTFKSNSQAYAHHRIGALLSWYVFGAFGYLLYRFFAAHNSQGRPSKVVYSWDNVLDKSKHLPLAIEDTTGVVHLDLTHADVDIKDKSRLLSTEVDPFPAELQGFLQDRYDIYAVDDDGRYKCMRVIEEALKEGSKVTVVGPYGAGSGIGNRFRGTPEEGRLLITEFDADKQSRSARFMGTVFAAGASITLVLAGIAISLALVFALRRR